MVTIVDSNIPDLRAAALMRIYALLRFVAAGSVIILAVWLLSDVLTVVFAAILMAIILHGTAHLLHRIIHLPYWLCLVIVLLVFLGLLVGLAMLAGPGLVEQASNLRDALNQQTRVLHDRLSGTKWGGMILQQVPEALGGERQLGGTGSSGLAGSLAGFLGSALGLFGTIFVVLIAGIYLAASPAIYVNGALRLVTVHQRPKAKELLLAAGSALRAWSAGQALDMLVVGILSGVGLKLLGVPLALVLGVVAGLANFVPYIGAITGAIPAILIAFSIDLTHGLETVGLYMLIQGFEGNVMAPLIQRRAVDLPPGLTILAQTGFGAILGIPGLIFATPLAAALMAMLEKATTPLDKKDEV